MATSISTTTFKNSPGIQNRMSGSVKWYDPTRGYGFIVCAENEMELFVHQSQLVETGDERCILYKGQPVSFSIGQSRPQGPEALGVVADPGYQPTADLLPPSLPPSVNDQLLRSRHQAMLRWYDSAKGYGFVTIATGDTIFIHKAKVQDAEGYPLAEGQLLEFRLTVTPKGLRATEVVRCDRCGQPLKPSYEPQAPLVRFAQSITQPLGTRPHTGGSAGRQRAPVRGG